MRLSSVVRLMTRSRLPITNRGKRAPDYFRVADNPGVGPSVTTKASVVTKRTHLSSATRLHSDRRDTELNL
jgi:hypothetical protein